MYEQFDPDTPHPDQTGTAFAISARNNLRALRDAVVAGAMTGWQLSQSGGSSEQPAVLLYSRLTERLRAELTWGSAGATAGLVTAIQFSYSPDAGGTWQLMGLQSLSHDAQGNLIQIEWS